MTIDTVSMLAPARIVIHKPTAREGCAVRGGGLLCKKSWSNLLVTKLLQRMLVAEKASYSHSSRPFMESAGFLVEEQGSLQTREALLARHGTRVPPLWYCKLVHMQICTVEVST